MTEVKNQVEAMAETLRKAAQVWSSIHIDKEPYWQHLAEAALSHPAPDVLAVEEVEAIRARHETKFPPVITAWCTKDGKWEFATDCRTLFPVGKEHKYVDADCPRQAACGFNNPDHFAALLDAFEASPETTNAGKLADALRAVARNGIAK
jgi:hypothetical protein